MRGYSETDVFPEKAQVAFRLATVWADVGLQLDEAPWDQIRCHEMARIVCYGLVRRGIDAEVVDGKYGPVEHSWIALPWSQAVLDVYAVGRLPQVQLVSANLGLATLYVPDPEGRMRDDLDKDLIDAAIDRLFPGKPTGPDPFPPPLWHEGRSPLFDVPKGDR